MIEYDFIRVPIVDIVNQIILYAFERKASDIYFDVLEEGLLIKMKFNEEIENHTYILKDYKKNLVTRIKYISGMSVYEEYLPQKRTFKGDIEGQYLEMDVNVTPVNGEHVCVMHFLYN